jgi:N-acetylglucosamine-6-sulfatase
MAGMAVVNGLDNIVFILSDDQDIEPGGLTPMRDTHTQKELLAFGAQFSHFYVATSICCLIRAQILSGRLAHNLRDSHYEPFPVPR